jgi:hypothetical protein
LRTALRRSTPGYCSFRASGANISIVSHDPRDACKWIDDWRFKFLSVRFQVCLTGSWKREFSKQPLKRRGAPTRMKIGVRQQSSAPYTDLGMCIEIVMPSAESAINIRLSLTPIPKATEKHANAEIRVRAELQHLKFSCITVCATAHEGLFQKPMPVPCQFMACRTIGICWLQSIVCTLCMKTLYYLHQFGPVHAAGRWRSLCMPGEIIF